MNRTLAVLAMSASLTDRYYVNGVHLGWTSNAGEVPGAVAAFGHAVLGQGRQRISISLTQKIFTPAATTLINPPANDEPYAGSLLASFSLIQDTAGSRTIMGFDTGVFGRDAGAEIVQNTTHAIIGQGRTHGWAYQLPSEPAFDLFASRIWRLRLTAPGAGLQADALPQLSAMAGTTEIYAEPGVVFRLGEGLDADFGAPLISPGPSGGDAFSTRHFAWYVRVVGSFEAGVALIWRGVRLTYTQVFQTERFHGQSGGIHEYGSLAATVRF
ncbi:MAG: hypothetical protein B7Z59_05515 [Acidiphilium sp. 37-67-22]|nr:MAG: hypothetical protein B7Z59_05515 [Acidiphilium sp. 37-67-22]